MAGVPLTQAQRALVQLLLSGQQSYADIASLLGSEPSQVRAQAREALEAMAGEDPDRLLPLTDYLLGQADEATARATARQLVEDGEACWLARLLCSQLTVIAPEAKLPAIPVGEPPARAHQGHVGKRRFGGRRSSAPSRLRTRAILQGAASATRSRPRVAVVAFIVSFTVAFIAVAAILVIGGVFGSGDPGSSADPSPGLSPGTIATVEGAPSGLGEISKASYERTFAQTAVAGGLKSPPKPGGSSTKKAQSAALSRFSNTYARAWPGRTTCAGGYVVQGCSNYVAPPSGATTTTP